MFPPIFLCTHIYACGSAAVHDYAAFRECARCITGALGSWRFMTRRPEVNMLEGLLAEQRPKAVSTFVTEDGNRFEFRAGDAAYFPPRTRGVWTIHQTLRKTYVIWR